MNKCLIIICLIFCKTSLMANIISWDEVTQTYVVDEYGAPKLHNNKKEKPEFSKFEKERNVKEYDFKLKNKFLSNSQKNQAFK